jgi:hypothetical protein
VPFTARPITWDELLYMGLAYDPDQDPRILNRYTHIYLLRLFMWVFRDPYLGVRVLWAFSLAGSVLALAAATRPLRAPLRVFVLAGFALLMAGHDVIVQSFGIPYSDYTVMLITSLSVALLLPRILRREEIPFLAALLLGLLFGFGVRSKEVIVAVAPLAAVFLFAPDGRLRVNLRAAGQIALWIVGGAVALAATIALDGWMLGDYRFYLSEENWRTLVRFNDIAGKGFTSPHSWMTWLFRPDNFASFLLYVATLVPFVALERNPRLTIVAIVPLAYLAVFLANYTTGNAVVVGRYAVAFLPVMCLVAALASGRLLDRASDSEPVRDAGLAIGSAFAIVALVLIPVGLNNGWLNWINATVLHELVLPGTVVGGAALLALTVGGLTRLALPAGVLLFGVVCATAFVPALAAANALSAGWVRQNAEVRFRDLNAITDAINTRPESRFLATKDIHDGEFWNRGPLFLRSLVYMNERLTLPHDQFVYVQSTADLPPEQLVRYEFLLVTPAEAVELSQRFDALEGPARPDYKLIPGPGGKMSAIWIQRPAASQPP